MMIILSLLFLVSFIAFFIKFLTADGDFTLLSKGKVKREEIEDKVIWITGASRGIGEILAKQLASLGAKLILSARNEADLQLVKQQLTGKYAPRDVMILPLDLTSGEETLRVAVEKAESFFGAAGVDYMIHNAAYERPKSTALDVTEETLKWNCQKKSPEALMTLLLVSLNRLALVQFRATLNVNAVGPISVTRMLVPYMLKRGRGHLVVMSSAAGKTPAPGQAVYSASKFALNGYFHTLRSEIKELYEFPLANIHDMLCRLIDRRAGASQEVSGLEFDGLYNWDGTLVSLRTSCFYSLSQDRVVLGWLLYGMKQKGSFTEFHFLLWLNQDHLILSSLQLCCKGIKVTVVCPGPVETPNPRTGSTERRVSSERCAELTIVAASHGIKEAWISYQPVLAVMYLVQYMPSVGYWLMDKIGGKRVEAAAQKGNTYSLNLLFDRKKES
ncbi:hypothetical protein RND71_010415 [Anisodus tanguticus]|uniref:Dehydrogenase/reductase SDR family member 7 n=1 Tax=Anisodus tanguticus TaxID=243964 RepID=A0AAE1SJP7_9SOLA|nr:hypothetical protein RND71_010415 [Anisodus tanguticus]